MPDYRRGDVVRLDPHADPSGHGHGEDYGTGTVAEVIGGNPAIYEVQFDGHGIRALTGDEIRSAV